MRHLCQELSLSIVGCEFLTDALWFVVEGCSCCRCMKLRLQELFHLRCMPLFDLSEINNFASELLPSSGLVSHVNSAISARAQHSLSYIVVVLEQLHESLVSI